MHTFFSLFKGILGIPVYRSPFLRYEVPVFTTIPRSVLQHSGLAPTLQPRLYTLPRLMA